MKISRRLRSQVLRYLARPSADRRSLSAVIWHLQARLPETVIFGGMLREFALGNARHFLSDIDLVSDSPTEEIQDVVSAFNATKNKFGGFRFVVDRRRFDLWPLRETWAFRTGHIRPSSFDSLLQTSFFNLDAAYLHLSSREVTTAPDYQDWVDERFLEINLEPNPNPTQMVRRALELVARNGLTIGPRLRAYLRSHGDPSLLSWPEAAFLNWLLSDGSTQKPEFPEYCVA